jgi:hypothetical protein
MARLFTGLLGWIEPHLAGRATFLRTSQIGAFVLLVPVLWVIGMILWISWGMADFIWPEVFGPKGNGEGS